MSLINLNPLICFTSKFLTETSMQNFFTSIHVVEVRKKNRGFPVTGRGGL
jgi:hypothetical protein